MLTNDDYDLDDVENGLTQRDIWERIIADHIWTVKHEVDQLNLAIEEYYASHWRDDESPLAEKTFGVKRLLVF